MSTLKSSHRSSEYLWSQWVDSGKWEQGILCLQLVSFLAWPPLPQTHRHFVSGPNTPKPRVCLLSLETMSESGKVQEARTPVAWELHFYFLKKKKKE